MDGFEVVKYGGRGTSPPAPLPRRGEPAVSLRLSDVFNTSRFRSTLNYNNVNQTWNNQWESRRLTLAFTCKIGSGKTQARHAAASTEAQSRVGN